MKMKFFYRNEWGADAIAIGHEDDFKNRFNLFVRGMLVSDCRSVKGCDNFLKTLDEIEHSSGKEQCFSGNAWFVTIRPTGVQIEFAADEATTDTFTIEQVRRAVTGWRTLLQMPDSPASQVVVDLR